MGHLKQRKTTQHTPGYPKHVPHLFSLNAKVTEYNNIAYNLVPIENKVEINSYDSVGGDVHQAVKSKTIRMLDNLESTKPCGLERKLNAGIGLFVCWSLTSLCHSNGHIETMPAREINPFTA